jgi:hypothetical protein
MAFEIQILDTGYTNAAATGGTSLIPNRAGVASSLSAVHPFTFNVTSVVRNSGANLMKEDELKNDESLSDVTPVTFQNPTYVLTCGIPKQNVPDTLFHINFFHQLERLERTKTIKVLYVTGLSSRFDTQNLLEYFGAKNINGPLAASSGISGLPYLTGFVKGCTNLTDNANKSEWSFQLTFEESR